MPLGITLGLALASPILLPDSSLKKLEGIFQWVRRRFKILAAVGLPLLLLAYYAVNRKILHSFMGSADEHSCYFMAECLRLGRLWVKPHPLSQFFQVVHVGNRDGKWFSVYPPGWPLLLALGLEWHIVDWLNPFLTMLALVFLYQAAKKVYGFPVAWLGLSLTVLTPFFIFTSASYFSHGTSLLMLSIFLYAFPMWEERRDTPQGILWAGLAGLALGYGLWTRYLTAAAMALPFLGYHFGKLFWKKEKWSAADTLFVGIALFMASLLLVQNYAVTGRAFNPPNHYDKRWERLGFRGDYRPLDGLMFIVARFFYLTDWAAPGLVFLFLLSCFQKGSANPLQQLFRYSFFYLVAGYFFYYSWGGNQFGPRYYYEAFPLMMLAAARGLEQGWRQGRKPWMKFLVGLVFSSLFVNAHLFYKQADFFGVAFGQRRALYDLAEKTIQKPSVVFIRGFLGDRLVLAEEDAVRNAPLLNTKILYAHDLKEKNQLLKSFYPDRDFYLGTYDRAVKEARLEKI